MIADFVEEVQVKSSGYTAEFGGAPRRRDQRRHQERHQQLARHRRCSTSRAARPRRRVAVRRSRQNLDQLRHRRVHHLSRTTADPHRARLRARRPDRAGPPVVLRRLPAGADDHRPHGRRQRPRNPAATRIDRAEAQVQYITGNIRRSSSDSLRARLAYNNSWSRDRGPAAGAERHRPGRHQLQQDLEVPELSMSGNMDWVASPKLFCRRPRRLLQLATSTTSNVTEEPRSSARATTNNIGLPRRAGQPAARHRLHEHPDATPR